MKKLFSLLGGLAVALVVLQPLSALAATTAYISTNKAEVNVGDKFSVTISVNPHDTKNLVEKIQLNFTPGLLEVSSFSFSGSWSALSQSGYDSLNNNKGVLIKTAGYPGGFFDSQVFGTVTFVAKGSGNGKITIGSGSLAFEENSQTGISGNSISVKISDTAPQKVLGEVITDNSTENKNEQNNNAPGQNLSGTVVTTNDTEQAILGETVADKENGDAVSSEITSEITTGLEQAQQNQISESTTENNCNKNYSLLITMLIVSLSVGFGLGRVTKK